MSKVAQRRKDEKAEARREAREARRASRRAAGRPVDAIELRPRLLIVCEGERTEPQYFSGFRLNGDVVGEGDHTLGLVRKAIARRDEDGQFTETWVVFDRDSFEAERFNAALDLAQREGLRVAVTNQAFELWYLLHFEYCDADLHRSTYQERLTRYLERPYRKKDPSMYAQLRPRQGEACRNAARLLLLHGERWNPEGQGPGTTIHLLVERLNTLER
ncbi:MAG: RloB family protein [bacterium]